MMQNLNSFRLSLLIFIVGILGSKATLISTTETRTYTSTTTSPELVPDLSRIKCTFVSEKVLVCDCNGRELTNETLYESYIYPIQYERFNDQRHVIERLELKNCELVENTTLLTNSMYHLNELSLTDCIKVPENVFSLMARRLSQEPLGDTEQDAIMNSLMIQYKKDTTDAWPKLFNLLPSCNASANGLNVAKDYYLHRLDLINIPNMEGIEPCMVEMFPYMEHLDLSYTDLRGGFPNLTQWTKLRVLKCRGCNLDLIPPSDLLPTTLEELDLSKNNFISTSSCLADYTPDRCYLHQERLYYLNLAYNNLIFFHHDFFKFIHFRGQSPHNKFDGEVHVDVTNNQIKTIDFKTFEDLDIRRDTLVTYMQINALDNPLHCNCYMLNSHEMASQLTNVRFLGVCATPPSLEEVSVNRLTRSSDSSLNNCGNVGKPLGHDPKRAHWKLFGEVILGLSIIAMLVVLTLVVHRYIRKGSSTSRARGYNRHSNPSAIYNAGNSNYSHVNMNNSDYPSGDLGRQYNDDEDVFTIEGSEPTLEMSR